VTYSGFTVADYATNQEQSTFPLPPALPATSPTPTPTVTTPTPNNTAETCDGELCISVTPTVLHCSSDGCDDEVTVESTGSEILVIDTIEFDGPAAGSFSAGGDCEHRELEENETCSITVQYTPGRPGRPASLSTRICQSCRPTSPSRGEIDTPPTDDPETPDPEASETPLCLRLARFYMSFTVDPSIQGSIETPAGSLGRDGAAV
jgi:hypothetical protein